MADENSKELAGKETRYLGFSLGTEEFAVPLLSVREVIALPKVTPIPKGPADLLGIVSLRDQVIPVFDLRLKLKLKPSKSTETGVIICDWDPCPVGMLVDSINMVLSPLASELSPQPGALKSDDCITAVYKKDNRLILLLDVAKLLSGEKQAILAAVEKNKKSA